MTRAVLVLAHAALLLIGGNASLAASEDGLGERAFWTRCSTCHSATEDRTKIGPTLLGILGRPIASVPGFDYSDALKELGDTGAIWDEANLSLYLTDPRAFVAGNKMSFQGVKDPGKVANIIAYLKARGRVQP